MWRSGCFVHVTFTAISRNLEDIVGVCSVCPWLLLLKLNNGRKILAGLCGPMMEEVWMQGHKDMYLWEIWSSTTALPKFSPFFLSFFEREGMKVCAGNLLCSELLRAEEVVDSFPETLPDDESDWVLCVLTTLCDWWRFPQFWSRIPFYVATTDMHGRVDSFSLDVGLPDSHSTSLTNKGGWSSRNLFILTSQFELTTLCLQSR